MNHSTPRPKGGGLLEVHPERRLLPLLKDGASRRRTGELQQGSETQVLLVLKARPEVPPSAGFTHARLVKWSATLRDIYVGSAMANPSERMGGHNGGRTRKKQIEG